jgi:hypothetical protein
MIRLSSLGALLLLVATFSIATGQQPSQAKPAKGSRVEPTGLITRLASAVEVAGYLTIDHGYDTSTDEALVRRASIVPLSGPTARSYQLIPIIIKTSVEADGTGALVLPCPRNAVDQLHVATRVVVVRAVEDREQAVAHKARIEYTLPTPNGGYVNPFIYIDLNEPTATGPLQVRATHWIVVGRYAVDAKARQALAAGVKEVSDAIEHAASIEYDVTIQADKAGDNPQRGDCSVKAYAARRKHSAESSTRVQVVEGYRYRLPEFDRQTGGCHFQNLVVAPAGLFMFDATTLGGYHVGPPEEFITTSLGGEFELPALKDPPGTLHHGSNLGFYSGFKSHGQAALSTPTFGDRATGLAVMAKSPPAPIARLAEALWHERLNAYHPR